MRRLRLQHRSNELTNFKREKVGLLALLVNLPEVVRLIFFDQLVVNVAFLGHNEWRMASDHQEEHDAGGEDIDGSTVIGNTIMHLGRHEVGSAKLRLEQACGVLVRVGTHAEVNNLQVVVFVEEHDFRFEVAMDDAFAMAIVEALYELLEVVARELV